MKRAKGEMEEEEEEESRYRDDRKCCVHDRCSDRRITDGRDGLPAPFQCM
jgi:hypothetical protein